jgi:hypothetical protein
MLKNVQPFSVKEYFWKAVFWAEHSRRQYNCKRVFERVACHIEFEDSRFETYLFNANFFPVVEVISHEH